MKVFRFATIAIAISLLLSSFITVPGAKLAAADTSGPTLNTAALPFMSPFLFAASAPVIVASGVQPESDTNGYSCKLTAQSPADWTVMGRRNIFNTKWTLKNTGTKIWGIHGVDVKYRGDTRLHTRVPDLFDLPRTVRPSEKITLAFDMLAPRNPGYYVENWGLYVGNLVFCKFYIVIVVRQ